MDANTHDAESKTIDLAQYIRYAPRNRPVYMPYLTVGDPDFESTVKFAVAMIDAGADIIELGIPFSDPTADGPTIQAAMVRALARPDFSLARVFEAAREIHKQRPEIPLVFLSYLNPILNGFPAEVQGDAEETASSSIRRFQEECRNSGVVAVVIPDLPYDQPESELFRKHGLSNAVGQVMMIAPNTDKKRFKTICKLSSGFIYYVTSLGVTGERKELPPEVAKNIKRIQKTSGLPVLAGFGFSEPSQVAPLRTAIDGVIVGSLHHRIIEESGADSTEKLAETTRGFVQALNG